MRRKLSGKLAREAVLEMNQGKPVRNLGLANALLHHGMVMQAARFYGAALEADPGLANAEMIARQKHTGTTLADGKIRIRKSSWEGTGYLLTPKW